MSAGLALASSIEAAMSRADTQELGTLTNAVCFAVLVLTILGAGWMMINMLQKQYTAGKGSTVRSRLVLFLVFGDFLLGLFGIIPTFATIIHHPPREGSGFCDAMAFLLIGSLWAQHLNNVALCVATYLVLLHPLSESTRMLERHWIWFLPLVWIASFVFAAVAWAVQGGFEYNNGLCFYKAGLFAEVYQFIPRGIVFTIITVLYFRLFIFLRRPDKIRSSTSVGSSSHDSYGNTSSRGGKWTMPRWKTLAYGGDGGARSRKDSGTEQTIRRSKSDAVPAVGTAAVEPGGRKASTAEAGEEDALSLGEESLERGGKLRKASATPSDDSSMVGGPKDLRWAPSPQQVPPWERLELPALGTPIPDSSRAFVGSASPDAVQSGWGWGQMKGNPAFGGHGIGPGSGGQGGNPPLAKDYALPLSPNSSNASLLKTSLRGPTSIPNPRYRRGSFDPTQSGISETSETSDIRPCPSPIQSRRNSRQGSHVSFVDEIPSNFALSSPYSTSSSMSTVHPLHAQPDPLLAADRRPSSTSQYDSFTGPLTPIDASPSRTSTPDPLNNNSRRISRQKDIADYSLDSPPDELTHIAFDPSSREGQDTPPSITLSADDSSGRSSLQSGSDLTGPSQASKATTTTTSPSSSSPLYTTSLRRLSTPPPLPPPRPPNSASNTPRASFTCDLEASLQDVNDNEDPSRNDNGKQVEEDELSLRRILEMTGPTGDNVPQTSSRRERERSGAGVSSQGYGQESGTASDGGNQESMARFMNRKASLLMLSFPLAYVLLFSISVVRILYYFIRSQPNAVLSAVSRWFVFSQGLVDALIYGLIEWKVKRTVRRKTRRGHFQADPSSTTSSPTETNSPVDGSASRTGSFAGRGSNTASVMQMQTSSRSWGRSGSKDLSAGESSDIGRNRNVLSS